jgi:ABC-type transport system involved in multi-copper enzyme maturation permease subunit
MMNIYVFELKAQAKIFLVWTLVLIFFLVIFMAGIYPVFYDSLDDITAMLQNFPPAFAAAFGIEMESMFSYGGFFGFSAMYITLMGAIMAVTLSVGTFAREKRSKCVDFLLTKPRSRRTIFFSKLLSGLTLLAATSIIFIAAAVIGYMAAGAETPGLGTFILAAFSLFPTQLVFYAAGVLFAVLAKKIGSVSGIATAFGFSGFILTALYGMLEKEVIRFIAPLDYFDSASVLKTGGFEAKYAVTGLLVIAACLVLSYARFRTSDAHAV